MSFYPSNIFPDFPKDAKIWIYQASRLLSESESSVLSTDTKTFVSQWAAHKVALNADIAVIHNLFLVIIADESGVSASGCSIDSSVRFVKEMEVKLGVSFFDRLKVAFMVDEKVALMDYKLLIEKIGEGTIKSDLLVFDNTLTSKKEWEQNWLKPINQTWLAKMLKPQSVI